MASSQPFQYPTVYVGSLPAEKGNIQTERGNIQVDRAISDVSSGIALSQRSAIASAWSPSWFPSLF